MPWREASGTYSTCFVLTVRRTTSPVTKRRRYEACNLESLEPRLALTTINYTVDVANYSGGLLDGDVDLTVRLANDGGVPVLFASTFASAMATYAEELRAFRD